VDPLLAHVTFPVDFFSESSISRKNNVTKRLGQFIVQKVLKVKKQHENKDICFAVLKPNERALFRKSSDSMENKSRSSSNYQITKNMT
jgi:hypothetical protein